MRAELPPFVALHNRFCRLTHSPAGTLKLTGTAILSVSLSCLLVSNGATIKALSVVSKGETEHAVTKPDGARSQRPPGPGARIGAITSDPAPFTKQQAPSRSSDFGAARDRTIRQTGARLKATRASIATIGVRPVSIPSSSNFDNPTGGNIGRRAFTNSNTVNIKNAIVSGRFPNNAFGRNVVPAFSRAFFDAMNHDREDSIRDADTSRGSLSDGGDGRGEVPDQEKPFVETKSVSMSDDNGRSGNKTEAAESKVTIKAEGRGSPRINFQDGKELSINAQGTDSAPSNVMASADFDSDGVADLVTADRSGTLRFYRGNSDSIHPNSPQAKRHKADGTFVDAPFYPSEKSFDLGTTPDFLEAGDFNGDGKKDILALAKNDNRLQLLYGDGHGNFAAPITILLDGRATAIAVGDIGRKDGQTDIAIAVQTDKASQLLVFEHPEGAFKHKPEVFKLPAPATDIAIGNLDDDFYGDVAVACGNIVTIVHGRGQAYPWDLSPQLKIARPPAVVANRTMSFTVAALVVGRFGNQRGQSLAILGGDGNVYHLEPIRSERPSNSKLPEAAKQQAKRNLFVPADSDVRNLATVADAPISQAQGEKLGFIYADMSQVKGGGLRVLQEEKIRAQEAAFKRADKKMLEQMAAAEAPTALEQRERAKTAFLNSISARPSTLATWDLQTLVAGSRFTGSAASIAAKKMVRARVSAGKTDDILLLDSASHQIQIISQARTGQKVNETGPRDVTSLDVEGGPTAILPMQLNVDALHDLVVLRQGAAAPSVVMSAPAQLIAVTSTADSGGNCQQLGDTCTLRDAIQLANFSGGAAYIFFVIGGDGVQTIAPLSPLPTIVQTTTIDGTTQPGYNGSPLIEITGVNLAGTAADGLKLRTTDAAIQGLAINKFPSVSNGDGSVTGGNGITIESTTLSPNNGSNLIRADFLGTDGTGTLDKGNDATGLNIFDSDNNQIGGTDPSDRNVMSGNGTRGKNGVGIALTAGNSNNFQGNIIGLNALGTGKLGNSKGLFFAGSNNTFGGDDAGAGNTVSGNGEPRPPSDPDPLGCDGFGLTVDLLIDLDTGELLTLNNTFAGNRLGTNPAGTQGFGNCWAALSTLPLTQTFIGSITQDGRNVISDNGMDAIHCQDFYSTPTEGGFCQISGNNIGTDITGAVALPNDARNARSGVQGIQGGAVWIHNSFTISSVGAPGGGDPFGVACTGFCNLISGNVPLSGVALERTGYGTVGVFDNFIGTNQDAHYTIPNDNIGVGANSLGDTYIGLGDPDNKLGNVISGNGGYGISVAGGVGQAFTFDTTYIEANFVGTDSTGSFALPNSGNNSCCFGGAISVVAPYTTQVVIGTTDFAARNIVSGNNDNGIRVRDFGGHTTIVNNLVGLNSSLAALGNTGWGITLQGFGTQVGGSSIEEGNQIGYNGSGSSYGGVGVTDDGFGNFGIGNTIRNNSIHDNIGLGIDLGGDGVTVNDECDQDSDFGANMLQNFPDLLAPVFNGDGTVTVEGVIRTVGHQHYTIDFYSSASADPSNHGEGETVIGSTEVTTDGNGFGSFTFNSTALVSSSAVISATATDDYGNTSEFSCNAGASCSPLSPFRSLKDYLAAPQETCPTALIVNVEGDQSDENPNDGVCDVDISTSGLQCTLRAALEIVTRPGYVGTHTINFAIPGTGIHTISPASALPAITHSVTLDGSSQGGANYAGPPLIEIRGNGGVQDGLTIATTATTIRGLAINHFSNSGIFINGGSANRVQACYLGIDPDGSTADTANQMPEGVLIINSLNNDIGDTQASNGNLISNNISGIGISGGSSNRIFNNKIGTDKTGNLAVANQVGVNIVGSNNNTIGQQIDVDGNLISGNSLVGIVLNNASQANKINGNYIGTKAGGMEALGNGEHGIYVGSGATLNTFGNTTAGANTRNIISGQNNSDVSTGILLDATAGANNFVILNYIGVNKDASDKLPNRNGVVIFADKQWVGNGASAYPNIISGNQDYGVRITDPPGSPNPVVDGNHVEGNKIGTNPEGAMNIGNGISGVLLQGQVTNTIIKNNTVSGNGIGIYLAAADSTVGPSANQIISNKVGLTEGSQTFQVPNGVGILLKGASNNLIKQNTVSGNLFGVILGVFIGDGGPPPPNADLTTSGNKLIDNRIGTNTAGEDVVPNAKIGLIVGEYAHDNCIGSCDVSQQGGFGNIISGHLDLSDALGYGVFLGTLAESPDPANLPSGNVFRDNIIGMNRNTDNCLPNNVGMFVLQAGANQIGVFDNGIKHGNIINCNVHDGISVTDQISGDLIIQNNWIGVTPDGQSFPSSTAVGVSIIKTRDALTHRIHVKDNTIGNQGIGIKGEEMGNRQRRRRADDETSPSLQISGNLVGVFRNPDNSVAKISNDIGIQLENTIGAMIGDVAASTSNIVSGNIGKGIVITGAEGADNIINNSIVGADENGSTGLGNGVGIELNDAVGTAIGDVSSALQNTIANNQGVGVMIEGANSSLNRLKNNQIKANGSHGILITNGARLTEIGGTETSAGNTISENSGAGVRIDETAGHCNLVDPNSIFANIGSGIDLGTIGPTPNDPGDADDGPNNLQNYPEFASALIGTNGNLILQYKVDSDPANSNYGATGLHVEFFKADAGLQGKTFVGSANYTVTDYDDGSPGLAAFDAGPAAGLGIVAGDTIIATATDADGNTSEFTSTNVGVVTDQPTAAKLTSFTATARDGNALLNWQSGLEVDNLGFNVYREVDGVRTRITPQVVAGSALSDGPGTSLLSGHNYYWADTPPAGKVVRYWLEDIDLKGKSTFNGPYSITNSTPGTAADAQKQSLLISQIGMRQSLLANGLGSTPLGRAASLATPSAASVQLQSSLASLPAVKIGVKQEGYYRVTQAELLRAALDPKVDPRLLQLFVDGVEQPIKVTGERDGRFDSSDSIEFYGVGLDAASTDTRVYWLVAGTKPGKRIAITQDKGGQLTSGGFPYTVERKDRTIYFSALKNGDAENFFGAVVASQPVDQSLWIQHLDQTAQSGASIEVSLQGVTRVAHNVRVQLNGTDVTRLNFTDQSRDRRLVSISQSLLREGENTVRLIAEGGASDISLVDVIRISYSHSYVADSDSLKLTTTASQQVTVSGFTRRDIRLMDVTEAGAPQEIAATVSEGKNGNTVSGKVAGSGIRELLAFSDSQAKHPWSITANQPSSLRQAGNGADLLIITRRDYFSTVEPLKTLARESGLKRGRRRHRRHLR